MDEIDKKIIKSYDKIVAEASKKTQNRMNVIKAANKKEVDHNPIKSPKKPFSYKGKWYTRDEMKKMGLDKEASKSIMEGKMSKGIWVTLSNKSGGELDSEFVKDNRGIKAVLMDWSSTLSDGDTIRIKKGSSGAIRYP